MTIKPLLLLMGTMVLPASAQPGRTLLLSDHLLTFRCEVDGDGSKLPVIPLHGTQVLKFSFDDLTHEYRRYTYRITHCDAEGKPTEDLFESDYVTSGEEEEVVEDYEPSLNTTVLYTHYSFSIPNARMRPLKSGNYLLTVSTENDEGDAVPVAQYCFGVVDAQVRIAPECTTNTDVDWNGTHQQISLTADLGQLPLRNATDEFRLVVMQNGRHDNLRYAPAPTSQSAQVLRWEHCRDLIFDAGNEYRKMEFLSNRYPGMHGESMQWFDPYYHNTLFADAPRRNYLYDEDQDGISVVRCEQTATPETEADYALTHFTLQMPRLQGRDVYVNGRWASEGLSSRYKMHYNEQAGAYECNVLLKQGYYEYLYLTTGGGDHSAGSTAPVEGNWFQTENEYSFLAYYRGVADRYWQLVGALSLKYRQ